MTQDPVYSSVLLVYALIRTLHDLNESRSEREREDEKVKGERSSCSVGGASAGYFCAKNIPSLGLTPSRFFS